MQHRAPEVDYRRGSHAVDSDGHNGAAPVRLHRIPEAMRLSGVEPPLCVITTPDRAGRLADRSPLRYLDWRGQTATRFEVQYNAMVVVTVGGCMSSITSQGHLRLPLPVRRRCRIEHGDRLLVVAWTGAGRLVICTADAVERMVLAELAELGTRAGGRW